MEIFLAQSAELSSRFLGGSSGVRIRRMGDIFGQSLPGADHISRNRVRHKNTFFSTSSSFPISLLKNLYPHLLYFA